MWRLTRVACGAGVAAAPCSPRRSRSSSAPDAPRRARRAARGLRGMVAQAAPSQLPAPREREPDAEHELAAEGLHGESLATPCSWKRFSARSIPRTWIVTDGGPHHKSQSSRSEERREGELSIPLAEAGSSAAPRASMKPTCRSSVRSAPPGTTPWSPAGAPIPSACFGRRWRPRS